MGEIAKMFFGSYFHVLDEKNRLCLPSKLRQKVDGKLYILKGYDGALSMYTEETFKTYLSNLSALPFANKSARDVMRIALSTVSELEIDKVNRIQIPTALTQKYNISKDVVVLGLIDHIEVWSKDKWEQYLNDNEQDFESKSESLLISNNGQQ